MASPDNSPPGPQGSSRATGGFMRGRAHGIALNIADFDSPDQSPIHSEPLMGWVCVYKFLSDPEHFTVPPCDRAEAKWPPRTPRSPVGPHSEGPTIFGWGETH